MADVTTTGALNGAAAARLDTGRTRIADSYETFLALLTTQLKNQDPTSPLDTNQFTQQLVQMTGVEQQLLTNDLLKAMAENANASGMGDAVSLIGKTVTAETADAALTGGKASWDYVLPRDAKSVELHVVNGAGEVVRKETGKLQAGAQSFTWDGKNAAGDQLENGEVYSLKVVALDAANNAMTASIFGSGVVSAVEQEAGVTSLVLNGARIPVSSVRSVKAAAFAY